MPHSGEQLSLTGTLRKDGDVKRIANSLITESPAWLWEDGNEIAWEDGETIDLE